MIRYNILSNIIYDEVYNMLTFAIFIILIQFKKCNSILSITFTYI